MAQYEDNKTLETIDFDTAEEKLTGATYNRTVSSSLAATAQQLYNKTNPIYPKTLASAVYLEDGTNVENKITILENDGSSVENKITTLENKIKKYDDQFGSTFYATMVNLIYPVGSVYFSVNNVNPSTLFGGTWALIGSKLAVRENVFGNGKTLGLGIGSVQVGLQNDTHSNSYVFGRGRVGTNKGTGYNPSDRYQGEYTVGVLTKSELGSNPSYSGLIVDTETIYSWKRTA